jgi:hypothetical protein
MLGRRDVRAFTLQVATGNFLSDPVSDSRNAQRARAAIHLWNIHASHRRRKVELRAASMPDAAWAVSGVPQADPEGMATPRFWHRLIRLRHVISGLLALASLNLA